jgi:hypothetical protein
MQAIFLVEANREQLRGFPCQFFDERPDSLRLMPDLVVLGSGHGNHDLFSPAWRLQRGRFSLTMNWPGLRSCVHFGILFCGKKKDDEKAVGRIPGTSIPAIR